MSRSISLQRSPVLLAALALAAYAPILGVASALLTPSAEAQELPGTPSSPDQAIEEVVWTRWIPGQYALADDGEAIWVGTAMGLLRWDKAAGDFRRVTQFESFPQTSVYAAVVDPAGNRWFGGNVGLSQLDAGGRWSHFTSDTSGLHAGTIDGIAVEADGTVWASHGLPYGAVTRLDPDGTWRQFPNRAAAIVADYSDILSTQNLNPLWLAVDDEVWMGYWVYDGHGWTDRRPAADCARACRSDGLPIELDPEPLALDKDSANRVWALADSQHVFSWSNTAWSLASPYMCNTDISTLNVDSHDTVWIGYVYSDTSPFGVTQCSGITPLPPPGPICPLSYPCPGYVAYEPPSRTYMSSEGIWSIGPDWLRQPNGQVRDTRVLPGVTHLLMHPDGSLWTRHQSTALQRMRDQGTGVLNDDQMDTVGWFSELVGWAALPGGDVFITWYENGYHGPFPRPPMRWRQGAWIQYDPPLPSAWFTTDVFAQDDEHVWFGATSYYGDAYAVVGLDDHGTPANRDDDTWTVLYTGEHDVTSVAVDTLGRVWFASGEGLFLRTGDTWRQIIRDRAVRSLVPGKDGVLFALLAHDTHTVIMIDATGSQTFTSVYSLAANHLDLLRSTERPNPDWSVAPDGGVWTIWSGYPSDDLRRYDETGVSRYPLPAGDIKHLVAGPDKRVWLVAGTVLWRLSPRPTFSLRAFPQAWLVQPGSSRQRRGVLHGEDGYDHPVAFRTTGLPSGLSATIAPNPARAGALVSITVDATPEALPGSYFATLIAESDLVTQTLALTITVASEVHTVWAPLIGR